jgi:hypothetical protein
MKRIYLLTLLAVVVFLSVCKMDKPVSEYPTGNLSNIQFIDSTYLDHSFILTESGKLIQGKKSIHTYFAKEVKENSSPGPYNLLAEKKVSQNEKIIYEISSFKNSKGQLYKQLAIYEEQADNNYKIFEITVPSDNKNLNMQELKKRRNDWVDGANSHHVSQFINNLYTTNAVYYYQSKNEISIGTNEIINTYQYMADSTFRINDLTPFHSEPVNKKMVFEIGTWSMPDYSGEYVIVWQRCNDNSWRILFDSNY